MQFSENVSIKLCLRDTGLRLGVNSLALMAGIRDISR